MRSWTLRELSMATSIQPSWFLCRCRRHRSAVFRPRATQGSSTVKFNGVTATPTNWTNTSIVAPVPAGATTGPVVVTVGVVASNGFTFSVGNTGAITGTLTRSSDSAVISGGLVEALQSGVVKGSGTSATDGTYTIAGLLSGTLPAMSRRRSLVL
jgi:hypothetical protein